MRKGSKQTAEARAKMSASHTGVKLSEEHRKRQSEARKGKPQPWHKGTTIAGHALVGPANGHWKGDDVEYSGMHTWLRKHYPKTGICEHCGESKKTQYANVSGEYRRSDRSDWLELCQPCHTTFDRGGRVKRVLKGMPARMIPEHLRITS